MLARILKAAHGVPNEHGYYSDQRYYYRDALGRFSTKEVGGKRKNLKTRFKDFHNLVAAFNHKRNPSLADMLGYAVQSAFKEDAPRLPSIGFSKILKANPYHDKGGRFTSRDNSGGAYNVDQLVATLHSHHNVALVGVGSALDEFVGGSGYGKPLTGAVRSAGNWGKVLNSLNTALDDMKARLGMDFRMHGINLLQRDPGSLGAHAMASIDGTAISLSPSLFSTTDLTKSRGYALQTYGPKGRKWGALDQYLGTSGPISPGNMDAFAQGTVRHELGHQLSTPTVVSQFKRTMTINKRPRGWVKDNISVYGAQDAYEAIAETFSKYTDKSYVQGSLPKDLENLMEKMIGSVHRTGVKTKTKTKTKTKKEESPYILAGSMEDLVKDDAGWDDALTGRERTPEEFTPGK